MSKRKRNPDKYNLPIYEHLPEGLIVDKEATNAPSGYVFINNHKSRFGGERKTGLMIIE